MYGSQSSGLIYKYLGISGIGAALIPFFIKSYIPTRI
jgi:hypothetical protein